MTFELKTGLAGAVGIHFLLLFGIYGFIARDPIEVVAAPSSLEVALVSAKKTPEIREVAPEPAPVPMVEKEIAEQRIEKPVERVEPEPVKQEKQDIDSLANDRAGAVREPQPVDLNNQPPTYPRYAREKGFEGRVVMKVFVSTQGTVDGAEVARTSGYDILDRAALKAVESWKFEPAVRFGAPVDSTMEIPFVFQLDEEEKRRGGY